MELITPIVLFRGSSMREITIHFILMLQISVDNSSDKHCLETYIHFYVEPNRWCNDGSSRLQCDISGVRASSPLHM